MAIDMKSYIPAGNRGGSRSSDESYYLMTHNSDANGNHRLQCNLSLSNKDGKDIVEMFGGSIGVSFSPVSGVAVIHSATFDNSRMATTDSEKSRQGRRHVICLSRIKPTLYKLYGEHRRYYVDVRMDEDLDGNPVYVIVPNGKVEG